MNIRILTKNGAGLLSTTTGDYWKYNGVTYSNYPYAGHFDTPYDPSYDLNFGQVKALYYTETDVTNNNLIQKYYRKQFEEINDKNAKIITVEMRLTPTDIYNFRFNKIIFLDIEGNGQYWRVQSITNYDPGSTSTCTVELLKIKDITIKIKKKTIGRLKPSLSLSSVDVGKSNKIVAGGNMVVGHENFLYDRNNVVAGDRNSLQSNTTQITGNSNAVGPASANTSILGSGNNIGQSATGIMIVGNDNNIHDTISNSIIMGGEGITLVHSGIMMAGLPVINRFNKIDAAEDIVLWPFNDTMLVNLIDGSQDTVRQFGSNTPVNLIDAGYDSVLEYLPAAVGATFSPPVSNWILEGGYWNDGGVWQDGSFWID